MEPTEVENVETGVVVEQEVAKVVEDKVKVDAEEVKVEINNNKIHLARLHHHTNCHLVVRNGGIV